MSRIRLKKNEFRVLSDVQPIPYDARKPIDLNTYDTFYISYRENVVCPCIVESIHKDWEGRPMAWVIIRDSLDGSRHNMYANEIGRTPEEAIKHQWRFI